MKTKGIKKTIQEIIMILLSFIVILPLFLIVINSFKDKAGASNINLNLPENWEILQNYEEVLITGGMFNGYKNSMIISLLSVSLIIILSSMTAFIIQRRKSKITQIVNMFIVLGLTIPASIVPTYFILKKLHLSGSYIGIVFVYLATLLPISIFIYTGSFKSIPISIDESAIIEGCGATRLFFNIIFPLVKPTTVTVVVISFMTVWNDVLLPIYLMNNPKKYTVALTTYLFYGQRSSYWNLVFANIVLISLPIIIIYFLLQKYVVSGMTGGAVKG